MNKIDWNSELPYVVLAWLVLLPAGLWLFGG